MTMNTRDEKTMNGNTSGNYHPDNDTFMIEAMNAMTEASKAATLAMSTNKAILELRFAD